MKMKPMLWLAALALLPVAPVLGQPQPLGSEFSVDGNTQSKQHNPVAAFNAAGSSMIVWENDQTGLRGRLYDRNGVALTDEIGLVANRKLATIPAHGIELIRHDPAVAFLPSGELLLTWTEERDDVSVDIFLEHRTVIDKDVFAQKLTAAGVPEGAPVRLNTTAGLQSLPKILVRPAGDALVVWQSDGQTTSTTGDGIYGRMVHPPTGLASGTEMKLSQTPGLAYNPAITGGLNGGFAVAWSAADASSQGVFVRLFSKTAAPQGAEIRVNTTVAAQQIRPALTADPNAGGYLVVWQGQSASNVQVSHIYGQFVGVGGSLVGPEFRAAQGVAKAQLAPSVASIAGKHFLLTWLDYQDWFPVGLYAVEMDKLGREVGAEVQVNTKGINAQSRTSIALSPLGGVLLPWEGFTSGPNAPVISARRIDF
jgi:hypothetical protein